MTTNNTQGLDEILDSLAERSVDSSRQGYTKAYEYAADAKQAILQWVADNVIGIDELEASPDGRRQYQGRMSRNALRRKQRERNK